MKVSDVMDKYVDYVSPDNTLLEVARLIFGRRINGVPVCKDKKVVGFITERDILAKFYPSIDEYIQDPVHMSDFESMEEEIDGILNLSVKSIMTKNPTVVTQDTPLLRAQSLMFIHNVGRLPVVNDDGKLIGIITNGDVFRAVVGERLPFEGDEQFHDWLSRRYDLIVDWKARLDKEIPDLVRLFSKQKVKTVLDIGCGTGVHAVELAKKGFHVVGLDRSTRMIAVANEKLNDLSDTVRSRVRFVHHEYIDLENVLGERFDAAMFFGAGLAHNSDPAAVLREVNNVLHDKALIICQLANYEKVIKGNKRFYDFSVRESPYSEEREQAFLRFYDPKEDGFLTQNVSVFARGKKRWSFKGMHSMSIVPLDAEKVSNMLKKLEFSKISLYGGEKGFYYDYLFQKPFRPAQSDVLVIVAMR